MPMMECDKPRPKSNRPFIQTDIRTYSKEPEDIEQYTNCLRVIVNDKAVKQKKAELENLEKELLARRLSRYSQLVSDCSWIGPHPNYYNGWQYTGSGNGFRIHSVTKVVKGKPADFSVNMEPA